MSSAPRATEAEFPTDLLIDLPNWLGDQVMALPMVHQLVRANSAGHTVLHTRPPTERFVRLLFADAEVVASERKAFPLTTALRLRRARGRFAVGITLRNAYRAKILLFLAARRTYGSSGQGGRMLLSRAIQVNRELHQVHDLDPVLELLGLPAVDPEWRPGASAALIDEGRARLQAAGAVGAPVVALAPATGSGSARQWPVASFAALADRCVDRGLQPVVVIGPGERALAEAIRDAARDPLPVLGEEVDVAGFAGVLGAATVVLSVDSGAMHVAAALGTPVVALFGPTSAHRTAPFGSWHRVLSLGLECSPCDAASCPLGHGRCMVELSIDEVEQAVVDLALCARRCVASDGR